MDAIFTFHSVEDSDTVLSYAGGALRQFLEGLLEEGVRLTSLDEISSPDSADRPRAALTFDDGFASVHEQALPLLGELGVPATLYVVANWVGRDNQWPGQPPGAPRRSLMTWSQLRDWVEAGLDVGSHTLNHPHLDRLPARELDTELRESRARLEDELGVAVRHFAYPYGDHTPDVEACVARSYDTAVTTDMRFLDQEPERHRLPRIDSYYLRNPRRHMPIFGLRTRSYLRARAFLRGIRLRATPW